MRLIFAAALLLLLPPTTTSKSPSPSSTVPAFPLATTNRSTAASACHLDLSSEMFGGVQEACGRGPNLDRSRCCPVLAAWLFAAHARSALQFRPPSPSPETAGDMLPMMPETESQQCADELQSSLAARDISFPRPNASCDAVLCFCGIRLHEMGSLFCPAGFNVSGDGDGDGGRVRATAAVQALERNCHNASYSGCTRCLGSLEKLKGGGGGGGARVEKMMDRDCRLMGLTWLLAKNKSAYIPTVSAVLRAILYSAHPPTPPYRCSPDQENMPLAADSVQFQRAAAVSGDSGFVSRSAPGAMVYFLLALGVAVRVRL